MNKTLFALFLGLTAISAGKSLIVSLSFKVQNLVAIVELPI